MINDVFTINGKKYYRIEKSISNSCRGCVFFLIYVVLQQLNFVNTKISLRHISSKELMI